MRPRLVLFGKLLEGDVGRRQGFDDNPLVVTGDSLSRHRLTPDILTA
jgi:hypothetical protein